jgi:hypothetical protein
LSLKYVGRLLGAGGSGLAVSVAKEREEAEMNHRDACLNGGAFKHVNLVVVAAITNVGTLNGVESRMAGLRNIRDDCKSRNPRGSPGSENIPY